MEVKWHHWMPLAGFSEDVAFARQLMATSPPLPLSHPVGVLVVSAMVTPVKSYQKWWEIQLAIHPIVGR